VFNPYPHLHPEDSELGAGAGALWGPASFVYRWIHVRVHGPTGRKPLCQLGATGTGAEHTQICEHRSAGATTLTERISAGARSQQPVNGYGSTRSPADYVQYVIDLHERGEARLGSLPVRPGLACRGVDPSSNVAAVEWLTLASLRHSENWCFGCHSTSVGVGGTRWLTLRSEVRRAVRGSAPPLT
jgi:hypothetical protein